MNTLPDIRKVLNETLSEFALPQLSLDEVKPLIGGGALNLLKGALVNYPELLEKAYKVFMENYAANDNNLTLLYKDEEEVLQNFKRRGMNLALVTNKPQAATERVYAKFLAKFGFCRVLGQTEYYPVKPNPTSTLGVIAELGVKKEECVFVGDGETDVQTALRAGIKDVAALWGYRTREQLSAAGAKVFAENYRELESIVTGF